MSSPQHSQMKMIPSLDIDLRKQSIEDKGGKEDEAESLLCVLLLEPEDITSFSGKCTTDN